MTTRDGAGPPGVLAPAVTPLPASAEAALFGCVAVGLVLPLLDIYSYGGRLAILPSLQVDAATYDALATALARGGSLADIPVRQPPGFVVLLAVLYGVVGHSLAAAKLALWVCLAASVRLAAAVARQVWGAAAGPVAAALVATAPALRYYVGTVQYEVLVGAWWLGLIWLVAAAARADGGRRRLGLTVAALWCGALVLTREVFIGLAPLLAAWAAWSCEAGWSPARRATEMLVFILLALTPVSAWSAYQSARSGQLVIISDKGPVTFALGNHPGASGTYDVEIIEEPSGLAFVRQHPSDALRLVARKSGYFWGLLRDVWNVPRPAALWLHRASFGLVPLPLLLAASRGGWLLAGFVVSTLCLLRRRRAAAWWILPASVLAVWAAHATTLASHRFAVPILPVLFCLIAGPASEVVAVAWPWIAARRVRQLAVATTVIAAGAAQAGPWPTDLTFRAARMDAMNAVNVRDEATGAIVRFVEAGGRPRPALVLADQYLPRGDFQVLLVTRRRGAAVAGDTPVARAAVTTVDGGTACAEDIPAGAIPTAGFGDVWIPCALPADGPTTIVVETLGLDALWFDEVALVRRLSR